MTVGRSGTATILPNMKATRRNAQNVQMNTANQTIVITKGVVCASFNSGDVTIIGNVKKVSRKPARLARLM